MWENLTKTNISYLNLGLRASIVYIAVLLLLRAGGKRQIGQMSPTEFVAVLLISNAVQNAMNGGDNSLVGGLFLAAVLIALSWAISVLTYRSRRMSIIFEGKPTLLVHKGQVIAPHLSAERLRPSELKMLLQKQGVHSLKEVATAVLEADGTLSITKFSDLEGKAPAAPSGK